MFKKKNQQQSETARTRQPTLERSLGTSVFSYHASRAARPGVAGRQEQPEPSAVTQRSKRRSQLLSRGVWLVVGVTVAVLTVLNLFLSTTPSVVPLSNPQSAVFLRDRQVYDVAARQALRHSWFSQSKLTINAPKIEAELRAQFPELAHVTVSVPFVGSRVSVVVEPAAPQLLLASGNDLYIVDETGRALMSAKQVPHIEKLGLPVITDQSGLPIALNQPVLPRSTVAFITEVVGQLKAKKLAITSLILPQASNELDVRLGGVPYFVKFNVQGDARAEAGAYLAVKDQLEREHKTPGAYIDVRVEDRAYYK